MNDDDIEKIECLIGYLEYWCKNGTPKLPPQELPAIIEEAKQWLAKNTEQQVQADSSNKE